MSVYHNVIITYGYDNAGHQAEAINKWLHFTYGTFGEPIQEEPGGLLSGQVKNIDPDQLLEFLSSLEWEDPEDVQILIKHEDRTRFDIFYLDRELRRSITEQRPLGKLVMAEYKCELCLQEVPRSGHVKPKDCPKWEIREMLRHRLGVRNI